MYRQVKHPVGEEAAPIKLAGSQLSRLQTAR
jgi:hypothetical protein